MKNVVTILTLILLALPTSLRAEEEYVGSEERIQRAFELIANAKGIEHSVNNYVQRDDKSLDKLLEQTEIHNFRIGRANFKLLDKLQEVFTSLDSHVLLLSIYTSFNPIQYSTRQRLSIKTSKGDIIIGERPRSSYAVAIYQDPENKDFRTVYAVEWWETDDKDIRQGILIRTYGEKVKKREGDVDAGSLFNNGVPGTASSHSIPFDGSNLKEWMNRAINNLGNLESDDWLRLFGLLTQKIEDDAPKDKVDKENLVLASGIILQLCKAAPIDDDEREICSKRLNILATKIMKHSMYVGDTLRLAAGKLTED